MMARRTLAINLIGVLAVAAASCTRDAFAPTLPRTSLTGISPQGGSASVSTTTAITVRFDHAMPASMQAYVTLHQGDVTGSLVPCSAAWSADSLTLNMTPTNPLQPSTTYTIHMGGAIMDAFGDSVDLGRHGTGMGGESASGSMMTGSGMMGGGGPMAGQEMGPGWAGGDGMYGMVFTFTTS
jgi:hypothetical protein